MFKVVIDHFYSPQHHEKHDRFLIVNIGQRDKNNIKSKAKYLAAPDARFVYQRLISDALVKKYENPKLLKI